MNLSRDVLDEILTLQLLIAWAGESAGPDSPRLGWWKTDVIDAEGGGDLWARLVPRTKLWAGLHAARKAAQLTDQAARQAHARADEMLTLFHFGFDLDEALDERLQLLKAGERSPFDALPRLRAIGDRPAPAALKTLVAGEGAAPSFRVIPGGRQLKTSAGKGATLAVQLATVALTDPPAEYPLPFVFGEPAVADR